MGRRVVLIVGPPGAGKTTLATTMAEAEDLQHIEREDYEDDDQYKREAHRLAHEPDAQLITIRCCITMEEQAEWVGRIDPTETIIVDTPEREAIHRCKMRGRANWRSEVVAVRRWWAARRASQWSSGVW